MTNRDEPIIAIKGLCGWTVYGRCPYGTYHAGPYFDVPVCKYAFDLSHIYEKQDVGVSVSQIWKRPNLDLSLPDSNVRSLFEGCIGNAGSTQGHEWNGDLASLSSGDSVGVDIYIAILRQAGATQVK